jgi:hypothetical protein
MSDDCPSEGRTSNGSKTVSTRSRKDLKAALMRMAFDGVSAHSPAEMILLIQWRLSASKPSAAHADILDDINAYGFETPPRSILLLDAMARFVEAEAAALGNPAPIRVRYEYTPSRHLTPSMVQ